MTRTILCSFIITIIACSSLGAPAKQVLNLPAQANYLTTDGTRIFALLENNQVLQIEKSSQTKIGGLWSSSAPIVYAHGRLHGIGLTGELQVWQNKQLSSSQNAKLSLQAGVLPLPAGVIAVTQTGDLVRLEDNGQTWEITARAKLNALTDQQIGFADLEGDHDREVVALVGANTSRYQHGILGDSIEATAVVALERHTLEVLWRYDLPAPYVFEDITLRTFQIGTREQLVTVRSSRNGGAALAMLGLNAGQLELRAGADIGQANRWLNPIVGKTDIYAIHTPHIGGILVKYEPNKLGGSQKLTDLSNHSISSRILEPSLQLSTGELVIPSQNHQIMKTISCSNQCRVLQTHDLGAAYSSNLVLLGERKIIATANKKLHFW
ncbi:MAG: hypothetical protein RLZZ156_659 [Deinococcota bacterium]|jgi:hypothetical protein